MPGKRGRVNYIRMIGKERVSDAEARDAEDLLARVVASAFAADHPEFFRRVDTVANTPQVPPAQSVAAIIALQRNGSTVDQRTLE
jgi:hypothetical protein